MTDEYTNTEHLNTEHLNTEHLNSKYNVPDCLVLKLEELESKTDTIDTTVYILYDKEKKHYVIRGKRKITPKLKSSSYSFICNYEKEVVSFLQYVICSSNVVNETLYNYNNLSYDSNNITFEFLKKNEDVSNELAGYDNREIKTNIFLRKLRLLKNVFNYYN